MNDISELEKRITAALETISTGLDAMGAAPNAQDDVSAELQTALEEERTANAQLEDRLRSVKEQHEMSLQDMRTEASRLRDLLATEEATLAQLRRVNDELRANNAALRSAAEAGVAEPHLINKAMMAELEGVRAAQTADRVELDAVLSELGNVISSTQGNEETADA